MGHGTLEKIVYFNRTDGIEKQGSFLCKIRTLLFIFGSEGELFHFLKKDLTPWVNQVSALGIKLVINSDN